MLSCRAAARLQQVGELGVAEGDVGGAAGQGVDAVPQGGQALVDELRLLQPPVRLGAGAQPGLVQALAACQVHQPQLGPPDVPCMCARRCACRCCSASRQLPMRTPTSKREHPAVRA